MIKIAANFLLAIAVATALAAILGARAPMLIALNLIVIAGVAGAVVFGLVVLVEADRKARGEDLSI